MKKFTFLAVSFIILSIILATISFFLLPEVVITQFSLNNDGVTTMPKWMAIALPFALGIGGAVISLYIKEDKRTKSKYLIVSGVGVVIFIIMLIANCFMVK